MSSAHAKHWVVTGAERPPRVALICSHGGAGRPATLAVMVREAERSFYAQPWGDGWIAQIRGPHPQVLRDRDGQGVLLQGEDRAWVEVRDQETLDRLGLTGAEPERWKWVYTCRVCDALGHTRAPVPLRGETWARVFGTLLESATGPSEIELDSLRAAVTR